ncbi:MAG TPA: hypothetical protein VIK35_05365 [Verrucomicrobiae bacterium]
MKKTVWLAFVMTVLVTLASCLLPSHIPNRILIRVENEKDIQAPTVAMSGYDAYFIQQNYCIITKFPVVNPAQ